MRELYYKIGEVSEMLGVEQYTLRYLENTLKLKIKRDERGERLYSDHDIDVLRLILKLKNEKGLNTTAIKLALENMEDNETQAVRPVNPSETQLRELGSLLTQLLDQNDELLRQNSEMKRQLSELQQRLEKMDHKRSERIEELIQLWRNDQEERNRSWLTLFRRK